ncbi:MAG: hypothetical protein Q8R82_13405 [Hyphomonadaceae bacterium]|nr:hypothetical protein [Hyphomonadaceae bacterium]
MNQIEQDKKDWGVRLAEMLRRLTVVVGLLWFLITAAMALSIAFQSRTA